MEYLFNQCLIKIVINGVISLTVCVRQKKQGIKFHYLLYFYTCQPHYETLKINYTVHPQNLHKCIQIIKIFGTILQFTRLS